MTPIFPAILSPALSVLCRGHPVCCSRSPKVEIWHQWHGGTKRLCAASLPSIPSPWSSRCPTLDLRFPFLPCSFRQTVCSLSKISLPTTTMIDQEALNRSTYQASAATWPFTAITTILFGMRAFSRFYVQKDALGWDDLVISISWVCSLLRQLLCNTRHKIRC